MTAGAHAQRRLNAAFLQLLGLLQLSAVWLALRGPRGTASAAASGSGSSAPGAVSAVLTALRPQPRDGSRSQSEVQQSTDLSATSSRELCNGSSGRACELRAPVHGVVLGSPSLEVEVQPVSAEADISPPRPRGRKRPRPTGDRSSSSSYGSCAFVHPLSVALAPPAFTAIATAASPWQMAPAAVAALATDLAAMGAPSSRSGPPPRTMAWGPHAPGTGTRLQQLMPLSAAGLLDGDGRGRRVVGRKRAMARALLRWLFLADRGNRRASDQQQEQQRLAVAALAAPASVAAAAVATVAAATGAAFAGPVMSVANDGTGSGSDSRYGTAMAVPRATTALPRQEAVGEYRPRVYPRVPAIAPVPDALLDDDEDDLKFDEASVAPEPGERIPLTSRVLKFAFERLIRLRATRVEGLEVFVMAKSNRKALSGNLQTVGLTWDALALPQLQITGGAKLQVTGVDLKVLFLVWRRFMAFKRPFEVSGYYVFTNNDFVASPLIRRLVQAMLSATLRKLEDYATDRRAVQRTGINVLRVMVKKNKLVVDGEVQYDKFKVPFTYRTGVGVTKGGHVVFLKDPEVYWDNVGGALALPLVPLQAFDVDIGDNARIEHVSIKDGRLTVRARFVLSPIPPLVVANVSKRASFRYDLGERLSTAFGGLVDNAFRIF